MATLPAGWAVDYDGQRWFFRYTATNQTQYHFPTPGDEFPDFLLVASDSDELLPEEKLESERQVRKRAIQTGGQEKAETRRNGKIQAREDDEDEGAFSFESFGYLGPGSYTESKTSNAVVGHGECDLARTTPSVDVPSSVTSERTGSGTETATAFPVSEPSTRTYTIMGDTTSEAVELSPKPARATNRPAPHTEAPMLDSREITPSPVGLIAELVSESTARCEEEINPPPVELPDTGASWLEPVPVPNLVNQYPVELPSTESESMKGEMVPVEGPEQYRPGNSSCQGKTHTSPEIETSSLTAVGVSVTNKSAWSTNWMSTSPQAQEQVTTGPPKVTSRFGLPSQQFQGPNTPPNVPHEQQLHQEIADSPAQHPKPEEVGGGVKVEFPTTKGTKTSHTSSSLDAQLNHFPSVLRPGPRRSSQLPHSTARLDDAQPSSQPSLRTPESQAPPPNTNGAQYKAFQPPPMQKLAVTGRPHSQSVVERHTSAQVVGEALVMPDPDDHVRALRLPRSSTLRPSEPAATWSQTATPLFMTSPSGSMPIRGVASERHAASLTNPRPSMPQPSDHARIPAEPSLPVHTPQRPAVSVKMPSEPSISIGMPPEPSPPLHMQGRDGEDTCRSLCAGGGAEHSPDAHSTHNRRDSQSAIVPKGSETRISPSTASAPVVVPDTHETPPIFSQRTLTAFATMSANGPGNNKLRQMLRKFGRQDKEADSGPESVPAIGEEGPEVLPHGYIPPKGKKKEAVEWSVGHAE